MSLKPYLKELDDCPSNHLDAAVTDCFDRWLEERGITPYPAQEEAFLTVATGDHLILSTPTGSGKSLVAAFAHWWALTHGQKSFYTAPIKALVNEKFFDLAKIFGAENVGMMTGDATVNPTAPIICATAEILANQALREGADLDIGIVIMDEFHFVAEPERGWAWHVPLIELANTQFILLSATLGDTTVWKEGLEKTTDRAVTEVSSAQRPIPLKFEYGTSPLNEKIPQLVEDGLGPVYIVFFTQKQAVDYGNQLKAVALIDKERRRKIADRLRGVRFSTAFGVSLRSLLLRGIGVHHAGMLPKYRRLVERLAQERLLEVICGTDTLGVGINVPIRTVVFSGLAKFDGRKERILKVREFQQIAGRAGRAGYDDEGLVIVQATDEEIEDIRATRKGQKPKKRKPEKGVVRWTRQTFEKLTTSEPETLTPRLHISNATLLNLIERPGALFEHTRTLIERSFMTRKQKLKLALEAFSHFRGLESSDIVERRDTPFDDGRWVHIKGDLPPDLALNQPLSPFALNYLEILDKDDPDYPLQVCSVVESILEDPRPLLYAQERKARNEEAQALRDEGVSYQEMMAELDEITWPQPMTEELNTALDSFRETHQWARGWELNPKSVVREMVETGMSFGDIIATYSISRAEGTVLRYLTDFYNTLRHLISEEQLTPELQDIIDWLRSIIEQIDNSLLAEWEALAAGVPYSAEEEETPEPPELSANKYVFERLIRNLMFQHVSLLALDDTKGLERLDERVSEEYPDWYDDTEAYWNEYDEIRTDQDARSKRFCTIKQDAKSGDLLARQTICDPAGDHSWVIEATVDTAQSDQTGEVKLKRVEICDLSEGSFATV
ncbi:MAG: DUF3516 domain-containing protein [Lawsonella sp.]